MKDALPKAQHRASELLPTWHLPQLPTRDELATHARAMFVNARSLDEIVDRAYEMILASVGTRLAATLGSNT